MGWQIPLFKVYFAGISALLEKAKGASEGVIYVSLPNVRDVLTPEGKSPYEEFEKKSSLFLSETPSISLRDRAQREPATIARNHLKFEPLTEILEQCSAMIDRQIGPLRRPFQRSGIRAFQRPRFPRGH